MNAISTGKEAEAQSSSLLSQLQGWGPGIWCQSWWFFGPANMDVWHWACAQLRMAVIFVLGWLKVCLSFSEAVTEKPERTYLFMNYIIYYYYCYYNSWSQSTFWILKLVMHPIDITYLRKRRKQRLENQNPYYPDGKEASQDHAGQSETTLHGYRSSPGMFTTLIKLK